jgi:hypothetical protein
VAIGFWRVNNSLRKWVMRITTLVGLSSWGRWPQLAMMRIREEGNMAATAAHLWMFSGNNQDTVRANSGHTQGQKYEGTIRAH